MKIAVSLSDTLYEKAEQTAQHMGITRSKLLVNALEEYIAKHNGEAITQKLNEFYEKINTDDFARDMDIGVESLRELTKNDA
ncbi:MAG: ChpI protein [Spirochaetes bacterium]|nr:ChpI protein [Spirochaetota bacterium]